MKGNTALIEDGQKLAIQLEATANLFERVKDESVARVLAKLGYRSNEQASINLKTGRIKLVK